MLGAYGPPQVQQLPACPLTRSMCGLFTVCACVHELFEGQGCNTQQTAVQCSLPATTLSWLSGAVAVTLTAPPTNPPTQLCTHPPAPNHSTPFLQSMPTAHRGCCSSRLWHKSVHRGGQALRGGRIRCIGPRCAEGAVCGATGGGAAWWAHRAALTLQSPSAPEAGGDWITFQPD